ncbi:MAG: hypothetical protein DRP84_08770 [Spirochaetes bacterium]|nr:MAG: hypothetical protein DRP84_08770 [Spirochaetota bacterium]
MEKVLNSSALRFPNACIEIKTNHLQYYRYLKSYFKDIEDGGCKDFDIEVEAYWESSKSLWKEHLLKLKTNSDFLQIGGNTFVNNRRIITVRKIMRKIKVVYDFSFYNKKIQLKVFILNKPVKNFIKYRLMSSNEEEIFFELTYPLLYYPLFWFLENMHGMYTLHASVVTYKGKAVVLCGLEGIGKTSLALSLLESGGKFISDNLIFYDKEYVYPCYELVRINKSDGIDKWQNKINRVDSLNGCKGFYRINPGDAINKVKPGIFIFPCFSSSFKEELLSLEDTVGKAVDLSRIPPEIGNYSEYHTLYNILLSLRNPSDLRYSTLADLLKGTKIYRIGMCKSSGLNSNAQRVKEIISNT